MDDVRSTATADGYTVGGTALAAGTNAEHSVVVRQLPDAKSLALKTVETYGDGTSTPSSADSSHRAGAEEEDSGIDGVLLGVVAGVAVVAAGAAIRWVRRSRNRV
ncbi:hypothetical protein ACIBLA_32660 [Streptomyces sp. NPDC050433]|uniref:hypothetical protein n=1 Tax=Streptomyces sp. NPDC050433 TaxID=3365615 RepID=UPI00378E253B